MRAEFAHFQAQLWKTTRSLKQSLAMVNIAIMVGLAITGNSSNEPQQAFVEKIPKTLVSFKMIKVPDGTITIDGKEHPIKGISFCETEVTWDMYDPYAFRLDLTPEQVADGVDARSRPTKPYGAPDKGFGHTGFAALGVTYHAAEEYCKWLSAKTAKKYRLPTVAEWEYAARAGVADQAKDLDQVAWFWDNADDVAHKTATKKANAWGLFDMLGNIAEWATEANGDAVVCGGSFKDKADKVGYGAKAKQTPAWNQQDPQHPKSKWWFSDGDFVGFRIVCEG